MWPKRINYSLIDILLTIIAEKSDKLIHTIDLMRVEKWLEGRFAG